MTTKKSACILFGIFVISVWVLGSAIQAGAEIMKLTVSNVVTKIELYPVGDVEGHFINYIVRDGLFVLENGEVGSMKATVSSEFTMGKTGTFFGFIVYSFTDGSTIVGTFQPGTFYADPEKKLSWIQKSSGELISGSGRFQGIKGTQTMTGKILKPAKGEISGKAYNEFTLTYTLP